MTFLKSPSSQTLLVMAFLVHPTCRPAMAKAQNVTNPTPSAKEASQGLQKLLALKMESYHTSLREASLIVPPVFIGQEWDEVRQLLANHKFAPAQERESDAAVWSTYLLKRKACTFSTGYSLDPYLLASARNIDRPNRPARPGKLSKANVALVADINAPYSQVLREKRYPKGSVLDAVLNSASVREDGAIWPLLERITVYYGYIPDRSQETNPSGFHICVEFTASAKENIGAKSINFTVASGLDPWRSFRHKEQTSKEFKPEDTLEEIEHAYSSESWHGVNDVVEANKKKYLKVKLPGEPGK